MDWKTNICGVRNKKERVREGEKGRQEIGPTRLNPLDFLSYPISLDFAFFFFWAPLSVELSRNIDLMTFSSSHADLSGPCGLRPLNAKALEASKRSRDYCCFSGHAGTITLLLRTITVRGNPDYPSMLRICIYIVSFLQ